MAEPVYREQLVKYGKEALVYLGGDGRQWNEQKKTWMSVALAATEVAGAVAWCYGVASRESIDLPLYAAETVALIDLQLRAFRQVAIDERFVGLVGGGREVIPYLWDLFRPRKQLQDDF